MPTRAQALARNLRRKRLERAISLSELARRSGVSKATVSGLERGAGNPSVDTVWALAEALNVSFGELFADDEGQSTRVQRFEDAQIVTQEEGFIGRRLLSRSGRKGLEVYVLDLDSGARRDSKPHSPGVVEHVIVVSGRAEVGPDGSPAALEVGDCLTFDADRSHHYHARDGAARLLSLTDYP